jgi:K+/H+ antiporter YhaU regulatory subunit KhtT
MYKVTVRHQRLPGIGDRFDLDTASGVTVTVVSRLRGARDVIMQTPYGDEPIAAAVLTEGEAAGLAALLVGVQVELVLTAT